MANVPILRSAIANSLKDNLDEIVDDDLTGSEANLTCTKWMKKKGMEDAYEDDLEMGGLPLASSTEEAAAMSIGSIQEGALYRYIATKFTLRVVISEEAVADNKYPKVLQLGRRLNRSIYKTMDYDMTNILVRATNTGYLFGDGQPLASASHTLPSGATFSNLMTVPAAPSNLALETVITQLMQMQGHDSTIEGYEPRKLACPTAQRHAWRRIMGSSADQDGAHSGVLNVIKTDYDIDLVPIKYWTNTTTNWAVLTDAENGIQYRVRQKPKSYSWVENSNLVMNQAVVARWASGTSDPRGILFVNA